MQIQKEVSLAGYSTMQLGGIAHSLVEVRTEEELLKALAYAQENKLQVHVAGSGSNTIFGTKGYAGLVIVNKIMGITEETKDELLILNVGAGEIWDDVVALSVERGYVDIAALSLIPGTTGAAPVQNIGAYGQQVSDSVISVRAYDIKNGEFVEILADECAFSYRHSRFNTSEKGSFILTSVKLQLSRKSITPPFYADISRYFKKNKVNESNVTPDQLRDAVSAVRIVKLPDPSTIANCGSFFKNPVVLSDAFHEIVRQHPEIMNTPDGWPQPPFWKLQDNSVKISAGWLIEQSGFSNFHDNTTGMATWKNQALVVVNESAKSIDDLLAFKQLIVNAVNEKFNIELSQEPELISN